MPPIVIAFLLFVAGFAFYAITSARRRVARGGTWQHPKARPSTYIQLMSGEVIVLTDGRSYRAEMGNDASEWRAGHEVYWDGGRLYNRTLFDSIVARQQ